MRDSERRDQHLRPEHAAQLDRLLDENARLRKSLEGEIDPSLLPGPRPEPRGWVAAIKAVTPVRWHRNLGRVRRRLNRR